MAEPHRQAIPPPALIGVVGGGQLGRMLALAARSMGYRVRALCPDANPPVAAAAEWMRAAYDDQAAISAFLDGVAVLTWEFENVPAELAAAAAARGIPVRPSGQVLHVSQDRLREKRFLQGAGLPLPEWRPVASAAELDAALRAIGRPAVLKTAAFGYDGKGQVKLSADVDASEAWQAIGAQPAVLEAFVPFALELSVVAARGLDGAFAHWGAIENRHRDHILDLSIVPARVAPVVAWEAVALARRVMEALDVVGVLCVEFFLTVDGRLLVNELAPRTHNSGHLTIEASPTSQFEQQIRAICGLPLGDCRIRGGAAMANLLGERWTGGEPDWAAALAVPGLKLHLYDKAEPRPGRKMGHLTAVADTATEALRRVVAAREGLRG
jgi:5-(carboxyamino)imidazole ribonucleotide synthase